MPNLYRTRAPYDRPHWAARIENQANRALSTLLTRIGWQVRIQPFRGYGFSGHVRVLARLKLAHAAAPADHFNQPVQDMSSLARRGFRNFLGAVAPYRKVEVEIDGTVHEVQADRSGLIDVVVPADLAPGMHDVRLSAGPATTVTGQAMVADPERRIAVVSDIDDTVMVTMLPRPLLAAWNAFVTSQQSRRPVPGMPVLYHELQQALEQPFFVYLSTASWSTYHVLERFLHSNGFPAGPMLLTDWGPTNTGFFRSGPAHKRTQLARLAEAFPDVQWLLIGDDGQHDPQIYAEFTAENPDRVRAVAIRELSVGEQLLASGAFVPREDGRGGRVGSTPVVHGPGGMDLLADLRHLAVVPERTA